MKSEVQRYRMTFKCQCGNVFKKITTDPDLTSPPCPECKKVNKKTVFHRLGDGPIPASEKYADTPTPTRPVPNTIYRCNDCNKTLTIFEDVGETALTACYICNGSNIRYRGKISNDIPTGSITKNKCVDKTADIVMTDYGMTNLKDNVRVGESMAPKLAPRLQELANNMFSGAKNKGAAFNAAAMAKRAMSGALRDPKSYVDPVRALHTSESRGRA